MDRCKGKRKGQRRRMREKNGQRAQEEGKDTWEPKDEEKIGKKGDEYISGLNLFFSVSKG